MLKTMVMISENIDIGINDFQIVDDIAKKIYIKFHDKEVGRKAISLDCFCFQHGLVPTEKVHADMPLVKGTYAQHLKGFSFL